MRKLYFIALCALFFASCGRKNNNFLVFTPKEKVVKINRLTLPAVTKLRITKNDQGATLTWHPVAIMVDDAECIGYTLYKFAPTAFIPRKPFARTSVDQTTYEHKNEGEKPSWCYLVRAIYLTHGKTVEGPTSQIVCE